jgi:hypothetical protein
VEEKITTPIMRIKGGLDPDPIADSPNKRQKTTDDAIITRNQAGGVDPLRAWVDSLSFWAPDVIYTKLRSAGITLDDMESMSSEDFASVDIPLGAIKTIMNEIKRKLEAGSLAPAIQSPPPALSVHPNLYPRVPAGAVAAAPVPIQSGMQQPVTPLPLQQKATQQQLAHPQQQQRQQIAQAAAPGMAAQHQQRVAQSSTHVGAPSRLSTPLPYNVAPAQPRVGGAVAVAAQQSTARPAANTATGTGKFRFGPLTLHCDSRVGVDQYSMRPHAPRHSCAAAQRSVGSAVLQAGQPLRSASVLAQRRRRVL